MSYNWFDFLKLAEALVADPQSHGPREAVLRSAISRAYYAIHCSARCLVRQDPHGPRLRGNGTDHRVIIEYLQGSSDSRRQSIGAKLDRLHHNRIWVDYRNTVTALPSKADVSVRDARQMAEMLKNLGVT